jgi:hypothetical protein
LECGWLAGMYIEEQKTGIFRLGGFNPEVQPLQIWQLKSLFRVSDEIFLVNSG